MLLPFASVLSGCVRYGSYSSETIIPFPNYTVKLKKESVTEIEGISVNTSIEYEARFADGVSLLITELNGKNTEIFFSKQGDRLFRAEVETIYSNLLAELYDTENGGFRNISGESHSLLDSQSGIECKNIELKINSDGKPEKLSFIRHVAAENILREKPHTDTVTCEFSNYGTTELHPDASGDARSLQDQLEKYSRSASYTLTIEDIVTENGETAKKPNKTVTITPERIYETDSEGNTKVYEGDEYAEIESYYTLLALPFQKETIYYDYTDGSYKLETETIYYGCTDGSYKLINPSSQQGSAEDVDNFYSFYFTDVSVLFNEDLTIKSIEVSGVSYQCTRKPSDEGEHIYYTETIEGTPKFLHQLITFSDLISDEVE